MSSKESAHVELETSDMEKLRIGVLQIIGESQAFLLDAMKSMLVAVSYTHLTLPTICSV